MSDDEKKWTLPEKIGRIDHAIGAAIGFVYVLWLIATARELGFPRDEGVYFHAGGDYARWVDMFLEHPSQAMERGVIDSIWSNNHEHPSLMKTLFGLSHHYFYDKWHLFADASTAFRFPAMVMGGIGLWVTYLFGARAFSRRAGAIAAVLLGAMPAVFFNAHLACFDAPIMTMWLLCVYVYWRSIQCGGIGWAIASGVVYGLTLETKHNAWIMPAVVVPHALFAFRKTMARQIRVGRLPLPTSIIAMATIGPLVFFTLWPWMWNDTLPRVQEYLNFHMNHVYYNIEYLHKNYFGPPSPRSYAPVLIAATVPATTLVLFVIGAFDRARSLVMRLVSTIRPAIVSDEHGDRAETDVLLFLAFSAPLAVFIFVSKTPIFGGTKHWLPAYPFLAIFAGRGFDIVGEKAISAIDRIKTESQRTGAWSALFALVALAPIVITNHSHPYGLAAYMPFVGGTQGGASLGLNRQFWGYTTESLAPYLARAPQHATVFINDTAWDAWNRMIAERRVRPDLQAVGTPGEAQIGIVHHELHMSEVDYDEWIAFDTDAPDYVLTHDGVPIISAYNRGRK